MVSSEWPEENTTKDGRFCVGNFVFGDWAGEVECRHGHPVRLFNIGRGHWVACDECRTCLFLGSNLWSFWRAENEAVWRKNLESVRGYTCLDS